MLLLKLDISKIELIDISNKGNKMILLDLIKENSILRRELRAAKAWIYFFAIAGLLAYGYLFYLFAQHPEAF